MPLARAHVVRPRSRRRRGGSAACAAPEAARRRPPPAESRPHRRRRARAALGVAPRRRRSGPPPALRVLDVGCGVKPYFPFFAAVAGVRRRRPRRDPAADLVGPVEAAAGRGRLLRPRALHPGARALSTTRRRRSASSTASRARRPRARLDARRPGLPSVARPTTGAGRTPGSRGCSRRARLGVGQRRPRRRHGHLPRHAPRAPTSTSLAEARLTRVCARAARGRVVNRAARASTARCASLREPIPGSLFANFHVVAEQADDDKSSSPAAPASSARTSCARCSSAATTCACSTTSRPAAARTSTGRVDIELVEGELRSYERVHNAVRGVELVFHLGALGSVPRSVQDPLTTSAVNVEGTLNVLLAARDAGVRRVVFASSSSVYGNAAELPLRESTPPDPISPYGVAKLAAERYCVALQPRLRLRDGRAPLLQRLRAATGPALAVRRGRAALHHRDRTRASRSRSTATASSRATSPTSTTSSTPTSAPPTPRARTGAIFNVAAGAPTSVNELAETIGRDSSASRSRSVVPPRAGDLRDSWADSTAAREVLGWEPHDRARGRAAPDRREPWLRA